MTQTALERAQDDMREAWSRMLRRERMEKIELIVQVQKLDKELAEVKAENRALKARKKKTN